MSTIWECRPLVWFAGLCLCADLCLAAPPPGLYDPQAITGIRSPRAVDVDAYGRVIVHSTDPTLGYRWAVGSAPESGWPYLDAMSPYSDFGVFTVGTTAKRFSPTTGVESLPDVPHYNTVSASLTGDGNTVVATGQRRGVGHDAVLRWTSGVGFVNLGDGRATDVTPDGRYVAGSIYSTLPGIGFEPVRFTDDGAYQSLGLIPDSFQAESSAISHDGRTVVGYSLTFEGSLSRYQPFRWTADGGIVGLGDIPRGAQRCYASDVSADGSIVVGHGLDPFIGRYRAFVWDEESGIRLLQDVLRDDYHVDVSRWELTEAAAISADGTTIVGFGRYTIPGVGTEQRAFVAVIPAPSSAAVLLAGSWMVRRRRR